MGTTTTCLPSGSLEAQSFGVTGHMATEGRCPRRAAAGPDSGSRTPPRGTFGRRRKSKQEGQTRDRKGSGRRA